MNIFCAGKPNDTFIKGSTNFRLEAVIRHELSLVHQKAQQLCAAESCMGKGKYNYNIATVKSRHIHTNRGGMP